MNDNQNADDLAEKLKKAQEQAAKEKTEQETTATESDQLRRDLEQMTEMAKRTMADLQNLRRRQEEERSTWIKNANADLIFNLLPILDNLDRALQHAPKEAGDWFKGIEMSINQLHKVLQDAGVKEMDCLGHPFNPDHHDALLQGTGQKDTVVEVLEKGYLLGDRVLRHAKVKVGDGEPQE